jgi:Cu2+-exporting ATPase
MLPSPATVSANANALTIPIRDSWSCAHCSLDVPASRVEPGAEQQFCCDGCVAVYGVIHAAGLERYYRELDESGAGLGPAAPADKTHAELDDPRFTSEHVRQVGPDLYEVELLLENVHCAACVWLIERLPRIQPAVARATVDLGRSSVRVEWAKSEAPLSAVAHALDSLGYPAHPAQKGKQRELTRIEDRALLVKLGVAGACFGNVMLMAIALYSGAAGGMDAEWTRFFALGSALIATPAVFFSGSGFFRGAWAALRTRTPHMDLPVSIGILMGWGSGWVNVARGSGDVYFDSIVAVVFLLLVGRYLERKQQRRAESASDSLAALAPSSARLLENGVARDVAIDAVPRGALLEVLAGESIPADGNVVEGESSIDSSLLTGESLPVDVVPGAKVAAGTVNVSARLVIRATETGQATRLSELARRVAEAARLRAPIQRIADRVAGRFVIGVLLLAVVTCIVWSLLDPARALEHTIALLVVTCPCALGLATPLAVSSALGKAARRNILVRGGAALEALARPALVVFDKTGTLTEGRLTLVAWFGSRRVFEHVVALEAHSSHPIARAFVRAGEASVPVISEYKEAPGGGIRARVDGVEVLVGSSAFVEKHARLSADLAELANSAACEGRTPVLVAEAGLVVGLACFGDLVRSDAATSLHALRQMGHELAISSGDRQEVVEAVARQLGVPFCEVRGNVSPEQKANTIERALADGRRVVMVGDGVNDAAALARSSVGIAVHGGAEASLSAADVFTTRPGVEAVREIFSGARRTFGVIRRNLALSFAYNLVCATLAVTGHVSPLLAAILMPLSSLTVVTSSYRSRTFDP